jgi:hypothetical protein
MLFVEAGNDFFGKIFQRIATAVKLVDVEYFAG